jgi:hypothetical protein
VSQLYDSRIRCAASFTHDVVVVVVVEEEEEDDDFKGLIESEEKNLWLRTLSNVRL